VAKLIKKAQKSSSLLPGLDKVKATLNPKNWGVPDYTDKGSRGAAFAAARKAGEKEFMWNGKRFNTNYKGTLQQQLKETGILDNRLGIQGKLENRAYNTVKPSVYDDFVQNIENFVRNRNRFDTSESSDSFKQLLKEGGKIHIKPENRGKFTATKKHTGKSTEELAHSKNPITRKRAIFA